MEYYIIPIALFVAMLIISELLKKKPHSKFQKRQFLLSQSELTFYKYLKGNIPSEITIMCKVRLIDIVKPISKGKAFIMDKNRIISKHIDFVLIYSKTSEIKTLIELNGKSHQKPDRIARDAFIEELTKSIGLNFFSVKVKSQYEQEDIREILKSLQR